LGLVADVFEPILEADTSAEAGREGVHLARYCDGTVVCLPTHGHTPGHQSLRLRLDSGEVVLAADAC
jgi:glyoxylase-like metal-dependent hydrolase (beta-lactamase superfamily II)